jgi:hypothetical protein
MEKIAEADAIIKNLAGESDESAATVKEALEE